MIEAKGHNGTVTFDGQFVTIIRKGFLARASVGKGDKRIPLASITAVQLKPPGALMNGYIEFSLPGGNEVTSRFGSATDSASHNENAVIIMKKHLPAFMARRAEVELALAARQAVPAQSAPTHASILEQIAQLASLRDQGVLTEAEFATKKTDLLSRL